MNKSSSPSELGAALIIVLAFLVILSGLVVAYLSRTTTDRQLAHGTFNETRSDVLARSALDIVVGDLKQEIVAGSSASTVSGYTIYTPTTNANMLPMLSGTPSPVPVASSNMVRRSIRSDAIPAPGVPSRASAVNSNTDVSLNGRSVTPARWNKHYLIPRINASSTAVDSTPVASFTAPDWVLVTRNGPSAFTGWNAAVKDASSTNLSYITGRYAYAIYDEGGLLDVNVAGFPSPAPSPATYVQAVGRKGAAAYADLTTLPASSTTTFPASRVNQIVGWRNYASTKPNGNLTGNSFVFTATSAQNFIDLVANNTGFLTVSSAPAFNGGTDQALATRQQLIAFRTATGDIGFSQNTLQYFGTFSRELNRPSWKPSATSGINPDLSSVRVTGTFPRADGTAAIVGEPLFKTRFVLPRINELADIANAYVQRDFGLVWDGTNKRWNYFQSNIETLSQVTAENREPNFFEVLKAVILNGSVGLGSGPGTTFVSSEEKYYSTVGGLSADYQIMQIGANIIDAWDSDNIPIFINFAANELAGVENLPYLNKLVFCPKVPTSDNSQGTVDAWLVPSLWNPHQNGGSAPSTGPGSRVRIALTGSPSYTAGFTVGSNTYTTSAIVMSPTPSMDVPANGFMGPTPQSDPPLATSGAVSSIFDSGGPEKYYGFHFVFATTPTAAQVNRDNLDTAYPDFGTATTGNIELQILLPDTTYKTYQKWNIVAIGHPLTAQAVKNNGDWTSTNKLVDPEYIAVDPRTLRFGVWGTDANSQGSTGIAKKQASYGAEDSVDLGPSANRIEQITWSKPQGSAFTVNPNPSTSSPSDLSLYATNASTGTTNHYVDLDGVQRRGDWTTDATGTGSKVTIMYASSKTNPPGTYQDRPQVLNAILQSVAELGQVFRDQPWKTLNFTTTNSADAGLLDAFTLQDVPMTAGRTSLNTRQTPVLTAILSQAIENLAARQIVGKTSTSPVITSADVSTIVNRLSALTAANPMVNKTELVTRLMEDTTISPSLTSALWTKSATNPYNKESRETVIRAFSDSTQTRSWNLMIDVIAQSGRYPPTAGALKDFVVEGEKRYWLHIAIDRFTGEVIDQQLEAVYE
ncbi:MAG: hypothetical protein ABIU29_10390 [Chthoniobacterales bacterium]